MKPESSRGNAQLFNRALSQIKLEVDFEAGLQKLQSLMTHYQSRYPAFLAHLEKHAEHYLAFLHLPQDLRKYFYTTNAVESFNASLERLRIRSGGFFNPKRRFGSMSLSTTANCKPDGRKGSRM